MSKKFLTTLGIFLGILTVLVGLLSKKDQGINAIIVNDNILNNFYLANRNLEDPVFIRYNDLSEIQIALIRDDYIKREVLKREALNWGLDKVDPIISSRLSQLGEQFLVNNLPDEDFSEEILYSFYNKNRHFYIDDAKITFSHIFFRNIDEKTIADLIYYIQTQDEQFFKNNLSNKVSIFPYQKNYAQRSESFIRGHFSEKTTKEIFALKSSSKWQGPIKSPYGFHIIKLSSISEAKQRTYDDVSELVLKRFISERKKENLKLELEKKISSYQIIDD
jgi:parvulin-like peptidyl-prolyl isomerase